MAEPFDVAIVGFRPAGAVAAGLLGQAGLTVWVADKPPGGYEIPRAIAPDHEISRWFQKMGVLDAVLPHGEPFTRNEFFGGDGQLIRRITLVVPPCPQGHVPSMVFSQPQVVRALRTAVAALPKVTGALSTEVLSLAKDAAGVRLQARVAGGDAGSADQTMRDRYAIAGDGGARGDRSQLGIALDDLNFGGPWRVVDMKVSERARANPSWGPGVGDRQNPGDQNSIGALAAPADGGATARIAKGRLSACSGLDNVQVVLRRSTLKQPTIVSFGL